MVWLVVYIGSIVAANVLILTIGFLPVGFGLMAPAGVFAAGIVFTARDFVQERYGVRGTIGAILAAGALSAIMSPSFALASCTAFIISEVIDMAVYTPLRIRHRLWAVVLSNTAGVVVDSALFLSLAFGSLEFLGGQVIGKMYMTALAIVLIWVWRKWSFQNDGQSAIRQRGTLTYRNMR